MKRLPVIFLLPFSLLYGAVMTLRNWLFDWNILKSEQVNVPTVIVGNLNMGGTGKSPHIEYLIQKLQHEFKLGIVSRGYGRKTSGYLEVSAHSEAQEVGDEPLQIKLKFPNTHISVSEKRVLGIQQILAQHPEIDLILLDDAMQHRSIKGSFLIQLSLYDRPFFKDWVVPSGTLREFSFLGKKRAHVCIYTKCPVFIPEDLRKKFQSAFSTTKPVYFSKFEYGQWQLMSKKDVEAQPSQILLVSGIAYPEPLINHLKKSYEIVHLRYSDHHDFTISDIEEIQRKFTNFERPNAAIVCTEKDAVKLKSFDSITQNQQIPWFSIPILVTIENEEKLINQITHYARTNSRSS